MFLGSLVNFGAILAGSLVGVLLKKVFPERVSNMVFQAAGLATLFLGVKMAFEVKDLLTVILSLIIGGIVGGFLSLERRFEGLVDRIKARAAISSGTFTEGFVTSSLLFCVGSMAIVGSIDSGLRNEHTVLLTKSILDGFISIVFATRYGYGVIFSAFSVLLYQGSLTLLASVSRDFFTPIMISQLTATGGLVIMGIGINLLELKKIPVLNFVPSLLVVVFMTMFFVH
jgi:uncharacterized protein